MELKLAGNKSIIAGVTGSNRTFMELKYYAEIVSYYKKARSNRTFMELKLLAKVGKWNLGGRSNRTFMELK